MNARESGLLTYSFNQGNVVPDGMTCLKLTRAQCPSNVQIIGGNSLPRAIETAFDKLRTGSQAVVWTPDELPAWARQKTARNRRDAFRRHLAERLQMMKAHFEVVVSINHAETQSRFQPHINMAELGVCSLDGVEGIFTRELAHKLPVQIVEGHKGHGLLLFAKNPNAANQILKNGGLANPSSLGMAFMVPLGSVAVMTTRNWGLNRASINSDPQIAHKPGTNAVVRQTTVYSCQNFHI